MGCPYDAVGMHRALDSAIGLPSRSTISSRIFAFLMPAEVSRNFMMSLLGFILSHAGARSGDRHHGILPSCKFIVDESTATMNRSKRRHGPTNRRKPRSNHSTGASAVAWEGEIRRSDGAAAPPDHQLGLPSAARSC